MKFGQKNSGSMSTTFFYWKLTSNGGCEFWGKDRFLGVFWNFFFFFLVTATGDPTHVYYSRDEIWSEKLRFYEYDIFLLKIDFKRTVWILGRFLGFLGFFFFFLVAATGDPMHVYYSRDEIWSEKLRFYEYDVFLLKIAFKRRFGISSSKRRGLKLWMWVKGGV
jgi:hypothetical protein